MHCADCGREHTRELRLPAATLRDLDLRDDRAELFALDDQAEIVAWLDARGLHWTWAPCMARPIGVGEVVELFSDGELMTGGPLFDPRPRWARRGQRQPGRRRRGGRR